MLKVGYMIKLVFEMCGNLVSVRFVPLSSFMLDFYFAFFPALEPLTGTFFFPVVIDIVYYQPVLGLAFESMMMASMRITLNLVPNLSWHRRVRYTYRFCWMRNIAMVRRVRR
jgi:hypothetical protein